MSIHSFKRKSLAQSIAEAFALKKQGKYAAAKSLIHHYVEEHPHHTELQALYRRIEDLQQKTKAAETFLYNL